jgi:hypothetical protein
MRRYAAAAAALGWIIPTVAAAQAGAPARTTTVTVYGNDPCPDTSTASDEIVVCARRPENDRYRIPKELRGRNAPLSETAWGARAAGLEEESRAGRPGSCSTVGSYGQTGCRQEMLRDWYAARRARRP